MLEADVAALRGVCANSAERVVVCVDPPALPAEDNTPKKEVCEVSIEDLEEDIRYFAGHIAGYDGGSVEDDFASSDGGSCASDGGFSDFGFNDVYANHAFFDSLIDTLYKVDLADFSTNFANYLAASSDAFPLSSSELSVCARAASALA